MNRLHEAFTAITLSAICVPMCAQSRMNLDTLRTATIRSETSEFPRFAPLWFTSEFAVTKRGELAVVVGESVQFFNDRGAFLATVGRAGEGPGEFRSISSIGTLGDSIWVADASLRRVSVIDTSHRVARVFRQPDRVELDSVLLGSESLYGTIAALGGDDMVVIGYAPGTTIPSWAGTVNGRHLLAVRVHERATPVLAASVKHELCDLYIAGPGRSSQSIAVPFCRTSLGDIEADGSRLATAYRPSNAHPGTLSVVVTTPMGARIWARDIEAPALPIPKAVADSTRKARLDNARLTPQQRDAYTTLEIPRYMPPFRAMLLGEDGSLWLEQTTSSLGHLWRVFDGKGIEVASLTLPRNMMLRVADLASAWVTETDSDDVVSVIHFRLRKSGR